MTAPSRPVVDLVLWDVGGVFTPSPFHHIEEYATSLGTTSQRLTDLVLGYGEPDGDHPWHRIERGELALADGLELIAAGAVAAGLDGFDLRAMFAAMGSSGGAGREPVVAAARAVAAAGIAQGVITNNIAEFADGWRRLLPMECFSVVIDSSAVGVRKPDPAIYELALAGAGGPDPTRVVFLDDHGPNVVAARGLGMIGIDVGADPAVALAQLAELTGI